MIYITSSKILGSLNTLLPPVISIFYFLFHVLSFLLQVILIVLWKKTEMVPSSIFPFKTDIFFMSATRGTIKIATCSYHFFKKKKKIWGLNIFFIIIFKKNMFRHCKLPNYPQAKWSHPKQNGGGFGGWPPLARLVLGVDSATPILAIGSGWTTLKLAWPMVVGHPHVAQRGGSTPTFLIS
jgi:hypothetical protein